MPLREYRLRDSRDGQHLESSFSRITKLAKLARQAVRGKHRSSEGWWQAATMPIGRQKAL